MTHSTLSTSERTNLHFREHHQTIIRQTDRIFGWLLLIQWMGAILTAYLVSPLTWEGAMARPHIHVYAAIYLGGAIALFPAYLAFAHSGKIFTRHAIAVGQMLLSALLIHLSGGRIETHFHVFGSLAFLAFYRDWPVLITATVIVATDHIVRGIYWPQSVYGVLVANPWRWVEHAFWVAFEDIFLIHSCLRSLKEMRVIAQRQADMETINSRVEDTVRQRTAELAASEGRFRSLAASSPLGIFQTDPEGKTVYSNAKCQLILELSEENLMGEGWARALHPENRDNVYREWFDCVHRCEAFSKEIKLLTLQGNVKWIYCHSSVIRSDGGHVLGYVGTVEDITERRKMEDLLRRADKMSAVGQLAAGVAHEINNPLGVILGFAQAIAHRLQPNDALTMPLQSIAREAVRCKNLVQDLLTFSRVSKADREPLDINQTIESALSLVMAQAKIVKVEIKKDFQTGLPRVLGNANQLQQVIINLANNALDAMKGAGTLTVQTNLLQNGNLSWVLLKIVDSGPGIPPEVLPRIFEPFFTTKPIGQGTGLGLSLVHEIIKKHSGIVDVQTQTGRTEFCIKLPVHPMDTATSETSLDHQPHTTASKKLAA